MYVCVCVWREPERPADIRPLLEAALNWDPFLSLPSCWLSSVRKQHADSSQRSRLDPCLLEAWAPSGHRCQLGSLPTDG